MLTRALGAGAGFPKGFLIVHDGENLPDNQNFKIVDMERILKKKVAPGWMY